MPLKKLSKTKLSVLIFSFSILCLTLAFFLSGLTWKQLVDAFPAKTTGSQLTASDWNSLQNDFGQCIIEKVGKLENVGQDGKSVSKPSCPTDFPYVHLMATLRAFHGRTPNGTVNWDDWVGVNWVDKGSYWQVQAGDCDACSLSNNWYTSALAWGSGTVDYRIYCCKTP